MPNKRFYAKIKGCAVPSQQLTLDAANQTVYLESVVGTTVHAREDISSSFKQTLMQLAKEESIIEIDGVRLKISSEPI